MSQKETHEESRMFVAEHSSESRRSKEGLESRQDMVHSSCRLSLQVASIDVRQL